MSEPAAGQPPTGGPELVGAGPISPELVGAGPISPELVGAAPIDPAAVTAEVRHDHAGAVVTFEGRVRDHDHDRPVVALTYSAHPAAGAVLRALTDEATRLPGVRAASARHRTGDLAIGDLAFFVAVAADHRREAFAACAWLVDETKARLPVWKHQRFADGTDEWVNCA